MSALPFLAELVVRTALIAGGTATVLWMLRIRTAAARHAAWTAVVAAMLVLPLVLVARVQLSVPVLTRVADGVRVTSSVMPDEIQSQSTVTAEGSTPPGPAAAPGNVSQVVGVQQTKVNWPLAIYLVGAGFLLLRLAIGTVQANRLRKSAVDLSGRLTTDRCTTPITVGWFAPALVLPRAWTHWSPAQLAAVLTHEHEHARRRDPLIQWLALFNRAVFWFTPLAWWLERKLATLAEEACDAAVIAAGHSPQDYSEYLLDMARAVTRSRQRVRLVGMAMPGAGLPNRVRLIFQGLPNARVSRTRIACLAGFCAISSAIFAAGTLAERAQFKFDVVSIRPCPTLPPAGPGRSGAPGAAQTSPGYVRWDCVTLATLIDQAYTGPDSPLLNVIDEPGDSAPKRVRGGPSWVDSERFTIEAKASGEAGLPSPYGRVKYVPPAMNQALRAMLSDRFQLKVRRVSEERPMYALTLSKTGLNTARVTPTPPDSCWIWDPSTGRIKAPAGFEKKPVCGNVRSPWAQRGRHLEFTGHSLADFAAHLSTVMDRYVINRTDVGGMFDFTLDFEPDDNTPGAGPPVAALQAFGIGPAPEPVTRPTGNGPTIFKAVEGLGLRLEPVRGPAEYLQIESAQRPRPDEPGADPQAITEGDRSVTAQPDGSRDVAPSPRPAPKAAANSIGQSSQMAIVFEAVAIRPCDPAASDGGRGGGAGSISPRYAITPGYVRWGCATLEFLIEQAWGGGGRHNALLNTLPGRPNRDADQPRRIRGGPAWMDDDRFEIEIRISGDTTTTSGSIRHDEVAQAMTPALRAMLIDRFQLKLRKETEERPMYALRVAPGGHKLKPLANDDCTVWKEGMPGRPTRSGLLDGKWICGIISETVPLALLEEFRSAEPRFASLATATPNRRLEAYGLTMDAFARRLASMMDRYVIDKSGIAGEFTFAFEYTLNENTPRTGWGVIGGQPMWPASNSVPGTVGRNQTIFKALEALGLRLETTRGPSEYLVVESAERPRPR